MGGHWCSRGELSVAHAVGKRGIDCARRRVTLAGEPVELTNKE